MSKASQKTINAKKVQYYDFMRSNRSGFSDPRWKVDFNDLSDFNYAERKYSWLEGRNANTFPNGETNREAFISWFGITPEEFKQLPKPKAKGSRGGK